MKAHSSSQVDLGNPGSDIELSSLNRRRGNIGGTDEENRDISEWESIGQESIASDLIASESVAQESIARESRAWDSIARDSITREQTITNRNTEEEFKPSFFQWNENLENTGNLARDHLANERTILAYIRLSTTLLLLSFGYIQLIRMQAVPRVHAPSDVEFKNIKSRIKVLDTVGRVVAPFTSATAVLVVVMGFISYLNVQSSLAHSLRHMRFPIFMLLACNIAILLVILVLHIRLLEWT